MQITVNKETLDFKLSEDITLAEVLTHIQSWADEKGLFILNYNVSDQGGSVKVATNYDMLSSEIDLLNVEVGTQTDLYRDHLTELNQYNDRRGFFLASKIQDGKTLNHDEEKTFIEGLEWIIESVSRVTKQLNLNTDASLTDHLSILGQASNCELDFSNEKDQASFLDSLGSIKNQALVWSKTCQYYGVKEDELQALLEELQKETLLVLESLEEIATDLTAGKESAALEKIETLGNFISDVLSLLHQTTEFEEEKFKLVQVLDELTSALSKGDLVTAADLVDYDVREILEKITFLTKHEK